MAFRLLVACGFCSIVSCATPPPPLVVEEAHAFSRILSPSDREQIKALVAARPDIRRPITGVAADGPNRARVSAGIREKVGDIGDYFTVAKRHGRWSIVSPIDHEAMRPDQTMRMN